MRAQPGRIASRASRGLVVRDARCAGSSPWGLDLILRSAPFARVSKDEAALKNGWLRYVGIW